MPERATDDPVTTSAGLILTLEGELSFDNAGLDGKLPAAAAKDPRTCLPGPSDDSDVSSPSSSSTSATPSDCRARSRITISAILREKHKRINKGRQRVGPAVVKSILSASHEGDTAPPPSVLTVAYPKKQFDEEHSRIRRLIHPLTNCYSMHRQSYFNMSHH